METIGDAVDRLLLREVAQQPPKHGEAVVVLDDLTGALSVGLAELRGSRPLRIYCDSLLAERSVAATVQAAGVAARLYEVMDATLLSGAGLVVARLPKSLTALDERAEAVAGHARQGVRLLAGGLVKHMSRGMNEVLRRHFGRVRASLGQQKARALIAEDPRPGGSSYPGIRHNHELDLTVCAHGGAFAGPGLDHGTRLLLSVVDRLPAGARRIADLGCGTGILATMLARTRPAATVFAVDESRAAVASARATAEANQLAGQVSVSLAEGLEGFVAADLDVVVCNPPFHRGTSRDSADALAMFRQAACALRPGGELWTVYNSHLPYLAALRRLVGPTTVQAQNPAYTVTRSRRSASTA